MIRGHSPEVASNVVGILYEVERLVPQAWPSLTAHHQQYLEPEYQYDLVSSIFSFVARRFRAKEANVADG
jgi:hypothetical protein